jgi:Cellulase (glycosyl hydrolase family 5)
MERRPSPFLSPFMFASIFLLFSIVEPSPSATITYNGKAYYVNGINVPWNQFGTDAGSHYEWGHLYNPAWFETFFAQCQQYGVNCVRWWVHCDGRSSPEFNDSGFVTGLDSTFLTDMADILNRAGNHNVMVMPCLWSFDMTKDNTSGAGKYGGKHSDLIRSIPRTQSYIDNALVPMVKKFASTPNLFAWEIINEPEWSVSDIQAGGAGDMVLKVEMQRFCGMIASAIHSNSNKMATVGSASLKWCSPRVGPAVLNMWSDSALSAACGNDSKAALDFYQIHYYDWMFNADWGYDPMQLSPAKTPAWWKLDKPALVGECPAASGQYTVDQMIANCFANGYCGIMPWSYGANDGVGTWDNVKAQLKAFRDAHPDIVDFAATTVAVPAGKSQTALRASGAHCVFAGSTLTLPEDARGVSVHDAKGRLLWTYERRQGESGAVCMLVPKSFQRKLGVVRYSR